MLVIESVYVCVFSFRPLSSLLEIICLNLTQEMITPEMKVCEAFMFDRIPKGEVQ